MTWQRKPPAKPTRAQVQAALNAQRPLGDDAMEYRRKKPRRWVADGVDDLERREDDGELLA